MAELRPAASGQPSRSTHGVPMEAIRSPAGLCKYVPFAVPILGTENEAQNEGHCTVTALFSLHHACMCRARSSAAVLGFASAWLRLRCCLIPGGKDPAHGVSKKAPHGTRSWHPDVHHLAAKMATNFGPNAHLSVPQNGVIFGARFGYQKWCHH